MDILKNKWVLGGAVAVVVLGLAYYVWTSASQGPLLSGGEGGGTSPLSQEILSTLSQLHTLQLDPKIFTDPGFVSLTDFGVTIPPQQAGRRNPFAPVGGASSSGTSAATGAGATTGGPVTIPNAQATPAAQ